VWNAHVKGIVKDISEVDGTFAEKWVLLEQQLPVLRRRRELFMEAIRRLPAGQRETMEAVYANWGVPGATAPATQDVVAGTDLSAEDIKRLTVRLLREAQTATDKDADYNRLMLEERSRALGY
jgi:uncharacterized protein (DUF305 family)